MDWEQLREITLGEAATSLITSGAGTAAGFVGAGFIGRQIQNMVKPDPEEDGVIVAHASITDAMMAWGSNNLPKLAIWYLARGYALGPGEAVTPTKEAVSDARKAFAGSIVFDTLMRLLNGGSNPASAKLFGWQVLSQEQSPKIQKSAQADVQRLIQENSALRAELNKALQRLAVPPTPVHVTAPAPAAQIQPVAPTVQVAPVPVQTTATRAAPIVRAAPATAQQPPVVRYTPVTPYAEQGPVVQVQPMATQRPAVRMQPMATQRPAVHIQPMATQRPPVVRATPMAARPAPTPVAIQPVPPAVAERERRYGFMQQGTTPPEVQERERKFGFMAGGEKDVATMFGML